MSRQPESVFRSSLGDVLKSLGYHVSQIESHETSAGIPDTNAHKDGVDLWIECKFSRGKPFVVRKTQKRWIRARLRAGCHTVFIAFKYEGDETVCGIIRLDSNEHFDRILAHRAPKRWINEAHITWGRGQIDKLYTYIKEIQECPM